MSGAESQVEDPQLTKMLGEMREGLEGMPENTSIFQQRLAHAIAYQTTDKSRLMALFNRMCDANMRVVDPITFYKGDADGS